MAFLRDQDLTHLHTMGCRAKAQYFVEVESLRELEEALKAASTKGLPITILGGGSNTVFRETVPGLVIKLSLLGIDLIEQSGSSALVKVMAGENWHDFVRWTLNRGYGGLENLSLIPGTVGAAPIQNIGAYGVEVKQCLHSVSAFHPDTFTIKEFAVDECRFGYRDSVFKNEASDWIIYEVTFRLSKEAPLNLDYAELKQAWEMTGRPESHSEVGRLVENIRTNKLPDPKTCPNSGSFFKNPVVSEQVYQELRHTFSKLVAFPHGVDEWKLAAGWLIQECGWKGFLENGTGVYPKQALVLINPGHNSGEEVLALASRIQASVADKFGVTLEIEPRIL